MNSKSFLFIFFILIIICLFAANTHTASIYSHIGDFYYKHNNVQKSHEYYEKAFDLGYVDAEVREKYINSILLNQLDITMQKKLIKFLEYQVDDSATQKVKYFLYNLKEEINQKYPNNYIMQAPYNQKIVRWGTPTVKYGFNVAESVPDYYITEIENAFIKWKKITNYNILFERNDNIPDIVINFIPYNEMAQGNYKYVVAYTVPDIKRNKLEKVKIDFYITDPSGKYLSENKIYNVALHEILHALGVYGHSYDSNDIMSLNKIENAEVDNSKAEPSQADIYTLKLLYKIYPDITNTHNPNGEYMPAIVLGNEEDMMMAKKIEARNYVIQAPNLPSGYVDLAASYLDKKDYLNAIKNLERALERSKTDDMRSIVYYNLGITYYELKNYGMAEDYLKQAERLHNTEEIQNLLAQVYVDNNKLNEAEIIYKKLLRENPDNIDYVINLTNIYVNKKYYWKARACLKMYFLKHPEEKNNARFNSYGILKAFL